jgi:hypothetical protein
MAELTREEKIARVEKIQKVQAILDQQASAKAPDSGEGSSPDKPARGDLYGNDMLRLQGAWGNLANITPALKERGMAEVARNSSGEIVAKGQDGKWYADQDQLTKNPVNWLESASGKAPGVAGMILGGAGGGALGLAAGGPGAAFPTSVLGAGAGSAGMEALKQKIAQSLGIWKGPIDTQQVAEEGATGMMGELGGAALGAVAKPLTTPLKALGAKAVAKVASKMSGLPEEATARMWARPDAVSNPPAAIDVAKKMASELSATDTRQGVQSRAGRRAFDENFGDTVMPTSPYISQSEENLSHYAPNDVGHGKMPLKDIEDLRKFQRDAFTSKKISGEPLENALSSNPIYSTPMEISPAVPPAMATPIKKNPNFPYGGSSPYRAAGEPYAVTPGKPATLSEPQILGYENVVPEATASDLKRSSDMAGGEVEAHFDPERQGPATRSSPYISHLKQMYGSIKDDLHTLSPEYGASDKGYNQYAKDQKLLKPAQNPATQENFIKTTGKDMPGRSNVMDAAERQTPQSHQDLLDMRANYAFNNPSDKILGPFTKRDLVAGGAGLASGALGSGLGEDKSNAALTAALVAGSLSPSSMEVRS